MSPWTPVQTRWEDGAPIFYGCDFQDLAFTDLYFFQTVDRLRQRVPQLDLVPLDAAALQAEAEREEGISPAGFVFHLSRCGSTLVSRLLSLSDRILVLAEPSPLPGLFKAPPGTGEEVLVEDLRNLIRILGRRRRSGEEAYVVKPSSVLTAFLPLFRKAFPETPWIFLFRDPGEVMVSVLETPTGYLNAKARPEEVSRWLHAPPAEIAAMSEEEYVARVFARFSECALTEAGVVAPGRCRMLDYRELPAAIWTDVARLFGLSFTPAEEARMREQASIYSKDPTGLLRFSGDAEDKAGRITEPMRAAAERWAAGPYRRLCEQAVVLL